MSPIAVLCSMSHEMRCIEAQLVDPIETTVRGQRFVSGMLGEALVTTAISGYGKVAAAATTATVIERFDPTRVIFGGVAGGIDPTVRIGDIVVADRLVQHDYDASPLFDRYVIPSLGVAEVPADQHLVECLGRAAVRWVETRARTEIPQPPDDLFNVADVAVHQGLIASGDRFIDDDAETRTLAGDLPGLLAIEMEGAAVAQVCTERGIPFAVFRSISDHADNHADVNFMAFVATVAAPITAGIVEELVSELD
ncbi:MAG: 5'-methylthioadenosine/adenosylhomocysteine nucleosidase [bacterium]|nr:5'-methylthioadenosine/adenosylhomocysteine nucleosidase [bacterium]